MALSPPRTEPGDHINYQYKRPRGHSRTSDTSDFISRYPCVRKQRLESEKEEKEEKKHTRSGCSFLHFSLARFPPAEPTIRRSPEPTQSLETITERGIKRKKEKEFKRKKIQSDVVALSLHIAAGECALKTTWSFKWKKSAARSEGRSLH